MNGRSRPNAYERLVGLILLAWIMAVSWLLLQLGGRTQSADA